MSEHIEKLAELFKEFPGIGERQAKRFVYFLLTRHPAYLHELAELIKDVKHKVTLCSHCFRYFENKNHTEHVHICDICSNPKTDQSSILIVEKDSDLEAVRRSGTYKGAYFVFGGLIPIADDKTVERTRYKELKKRLEHDVKHGTLKEVILAFSLNPHGEHTDRYLRETIKTLLEESNVRVSSLGRGLSTGSELEYSDRDTLGYALENRK
jgi:recombination protein RecR